MITILIRWEKSAFCRQKKKLRLEIPNGNWTVRFFTSHAFRSHLHAEFQNCNKIAFKLLLNHSKRSQYKTGDMKTRKACIGCSIPVTETLRSRFFGISREPRTSRSHVTSALPLGLRFEVHVCTARPRS